MPLTHKDVQADASGTQPRRRGRKRAWVSPYDRQSPARWALLLCLALILAWLLGKPVPSFFRSRPRATRRALDGPFAPPLARFSELAGALEQSELLALYFAASWCSMSTPISHALDRAFGAQHAAASARGGRDALAIVYVSSDKTLDEYTAYLHQRNWLAVPFASPQRNELKRHFATCAHRELEELDMDRKHEIPTIIVIDSRSQGIITTNGAGDVEQLGTGALEHWQKILQGIRTVEDHVK